jgi:hypothetical protein
MGFGLILGLTKHTSHLQLIITLLLIYTLYKSLQHMLRLGMLQSHSLICLLPNTKTTYLIASRDPVSVQLLSGIPALSGAIWILHPDSF